MKRTQESQDYNFVQEKPHFSHIFLSIGVYPHLTKNETLVLDAIWQRTSRFGITGYTELTQSHMFHGTANTYITPTDQTFYMYKKYAITKLPELELRTFTRVKKRLNDLGLICHDGRSRVSFYRISCYPADMEDPYERLKNRLSADENGVGAAILEDLEGLLRHLKKHKTL